MFFPPTRRQVLEQESLALLVRLDNNQQAVERLTILNPQLDPVCTALVDKLVEEQRDTAAEYDEAYDAGYDEAHTDRDTGYDLGHATGLQDGRDEAEGLRKAGKFTKNVVISNSAGFEGEWVAVPYEDFQALRTALEQAHD